MANNKDLSPGEAPDCGIPGLEITLEKAEDRRAVEELTREAFFNKYAPGCDEHCLVHLLRNAPGFAPWHSMSARYRGHLIGHILLSPAALETGSGANAVVMAIGPVSVLPAVIRRGVGGCLMRFAIQSAREHGVSALFLAGDPGYYHRFGFVSASKFGIHMQGADPNDAADWLMALPLFPGALDHKAGVFAFSPVFLVSPEDAERFDAIFPKREKLVLPGQLK